jgi:hypothetical protein
MPTLKIGGKWAESTICFVASGCFAGTSFDEQRPRGLPDVPATRELLAPNNVFWRERMGR